MNKLLVFVGEKIEVKIGDPEFEGRDARFVAKYKILERVCGSYSKDTIEFIVYDHYGLPEFQSYKTVLLYVAITDSLNYHLKYLFQPLYKTKNGKWAAPYMASLHNDVDSITENLKPVKIDFAEEVSFSVAGWKKQQAKEVFPLPFYKIAGQKAIAVYGNYIPELFELEKQGMLKHWGYYGTRNAPDAVPDVELEDVRYGESKELQKNNGEDVEAVTKAWKSLFTALVSKDATTIKQLSLDSVVCSVCEGFASPDYYNDREPIDSFIIYSYKNFPGTQLWHNMHDQKFKFGATTYLKQAPKHFKLPAGEKYMVYEISFRTVDTIHGQRYAVSHDFQFVKTTEGLKFYGMRSN